MVAALGSAAIAAPSVAAAESRATITIGGDRVHVIRDRRHGDRRDRWDRRERWDRPACSPRHAVRKAERMGVRHAHIRRVDRRAIVVAGRRHHHRQIVRFARAPGCPVIAYRR
ncbi:hypothetical protein J1C48_08430 [Jiella sp. CQZ9-1]|uniref:Antifreeze protein n=1 Tax=Jiella flava TaxID=2816857 RepID=A0A939JTX9_9HYPH|nr:hypothetical protein [Jiella flava]